MDLDDIVGTAISATENRVMGKDKEEKTTVGGFILRFVVSLICFFVALGISMLRLFAMMSSDFIPGSKRPAFAAFAIGISLLLFIITFLVLYLRKKGTMTRFLGIMALGDTLWWVYLGFFS